MGAHSVATETIEATSWSLRGEADASTLGVAEVRIRLGPARRTCEQPHLTGTPGILQERRAGRGGPRGRRGRHGVRGRRSCGHEHSSPPSVLMPTEAQEYGALGRPTTAQAQGPATAVQGTSVGPTPASDFMVDVLKKIGFEYAAINPGSTFQGLHESFINYGQNTAPELLTCLHEEAAAAMAHGYAKAAGKPMLTMFHGTVGLLHSSMALFQAWADRVPVFVIVGHHRNPSGVINRPHSAQDMGSIVRDFVKFDDEATTLERFAEAAMRAYRIAMTPPMGPVLLDVDAELQESLIANRASSRIPELVAGVAAAGRGGRGARSGEAARGRRAPLIQIAKMGRTPRALGPADRAGRDCCRRRWTSMRLLVVAGVSVVASAVRDGRPRLHARRDARPRGQRHVGAGAHRARQRRQDDQHLGRAPVPAQQHPRLRPLRRRGPGDRGRRRGDAAAPHRGDPQADHAGAQGAMRRRAARASGRRTSRRTSRRSRTRATAGTPARSACRG